MKSSQAAASLASLILLSGIAAAQAPVSKRYVLEPGTKVPLKLINTISTEHTGEGEKVYLETVFPILIDGKVVIPAGSYVGGSVARVKRPGRLKGKGELFLRFETLTLPNGVTRDFRARVGSVEGRSRDELERSEGTIKSEGDKGGDTRRVGEGAAAGAGVGAIAGSTAGRAGMGAGIGAAAGAGAALAGVLLSRGPDVVLTKGTTLDMVLDRPVVYEESELNPPSKEAAKAASPAKQAR